MSKKKDEKNDNITDSVIGATTTENVEKYGRAASEYINGYKGNISQEGDILKKGLKQISASKVHPDFVYRNLKQQAGFSAEVHYTNKTNSENIIDNKDMRVSRSNDVGLGNHTQFDVLAIDLDGNPILNNNEPLWSAQMKFCGGYRTKEEIEKSSKDLVKKLVNKKWDRYRGNKVLVPSEQCDIAKAYAEKEANAFLEKAKEYRKGGNIEKANELEESAKKYIQASEDITNSGISSKEAMFLREHPKLATAKYVAKTSHRSGVEQAKAGAIMSCTISTSRNIIGVMRGEKEIKESLKDIAVDTANGSCSAYIIGVSDTAIRGFMASSKNSIFVNLSKTNLPATIATVGVQASKSLIRYANGEIDSIELIEELGEKGTGMLAASWGAAIGTAVFPGVGTAIGGMIGYMTSSTLYSSSMIALKEEKLSKESRLKIHELSKAAIKSMRSQRVELEKCIEEFYLKREQVFKKSFDIIDRSIEFMNLDEFTREINNIAIEMGVTLQFKNFNEFDEFMLDDKLSLDF